MCANDNRYILRFLKYANIDVVYKIGKFIFRVGTIFTWIYYARSIKLITVRSFVWNLLKTFIVMKWAKMLPCEIDISEMKTYCRILY